MKNKTADLFDYICDCKVDLVAITETWMTTDDAAVRTELCPVGYKTSDRPRNGRRGGGVALIYRDSLCQKDMMLAGKNPLNTANGQSHHLRSIFGLSYFIVHLIQLIKESQLMISSRSSLPN